MGEALSRFAKGSGTSTAAATFIASAVEFSAEEETREAANHDDGLKLV